MNDTVSPSKVAGRVGRRTRRFTGRPELLDETSGDNMQVDSEYEQDLAESSSRGKKRKSREYKVNPQAKKFRGKRGLLKQLVEMPLDVLFEIFGHLKPLDLLHLARTTKDLRAILMKRSSISIWKCSRSQFDDLPDCPNDLSEPQYAEYLFGKACTFCHRSLPSNTVIWTARVRTCARCLPEEFSSHINPCRYPRHLLDSTRVIIFVKSRKTFREKVVHSLELHDRWEEEYKALQTASERNNWVAQRAEERIAINAHARLCERWVKSMKQTQEIEKTALIENRKAIVMERVTALGWADEFFKMIYPDHFKDDPYIQKICQKEITGRVLLHVDEYINIFMEDRKAKRLLMERVTLLTERLPILRKVYNTCVETYPVNSIIPCVADVFIDSIVQDLLIRPPLSTTFTEKDLETVVTLFPDIVRRWRNKTEKKLLNMITLSQKTTESPFQLATTIFSCQRCYNNDPLTYPQVLIHRCATATIYTYGNEDEEQSVVQRFLDCSNWNGGNSITFVAPKVVCLSEAIKLCGLDPKFATREEMDKRDPIFECVACNDLRKGRCTLSWLGVYDHIREKHLQEGWDDLKIELLGDEDAAKVRDRNAEALSHKRAQKGYDGLYCTHCKMVGDSVTLTEHVNAVHKILESTDRDIVPALDCAVFPLKHRLWPPRPVAPSLPATLV